MTYYVSGRDFVLDAYAGTAKEDHTEWVGTFIRSDAGMSSDPFNRILVRTHANTAEQAHRNLISWRERKPELRAPAGMISPVFLLTSVDPLYPFVA